VCVLLPLLLRLLLHVQEPDAAALQPERVRDGGAAAAAAAEGARSALGGR
jgi:hypothetical protein